ncbi:hypothetical protein DXG01_003505 [Tephrocybe rancida]|nr:hypothetical protein DXG01_003505 [Tephrocybe rancida]
MPKRRTDDDGSSSGSPKRARTSDVDSDEDEDFEIHDETLRRGKSKGKRRARFCDNDEEEEGGTEEDEAEQQRYEDEFGERIKAQLKLTSRIQGVSSPFPTYYPGLRPNESNVLGIQGIAEHGIIERVEMVNFMCHKFLKFEFGPQINFIIGHNGSGKSAVLSAITVALGGKSTSTGRGSGLKSFIKEGCAVGEVTIYLKNKGEEAFKHAEYGDSIIVTRQFTRKGNSTWKIQGVRSNQTISTKREELSAICDHMNIQVDNPLNVLTQARKFLSASTHEEKYKARKYMQRTLDYLFLRGTQLSQLEEEYQICLNHVKRTTQVLEQKEEALPDLKAAFNDASVRFEEAEKAREQQGKVDELRHELTWARVKSKEDEMTVKIQEVAKLEARLPKIEERIEAAQVVFDTATEEVTKYENEVTRVGDMNNLTAEKDRLQGLINDNKHTISDFKRDLRKMDQSTTSFDLQIQDLEQKIAEETERMAENTQSEHDETQRRLEEARTNEQDAETAVRELEEQVKVQEGITSALKTEGEKIERVTLKEIRTKIQDCEGMIQRAKDVEKNSLIKYGRDIKTVLESIKKERWIGERPVGPLGLYVKARDAATWGKLLRSQLTHLMTAYAVSNETDRKNLRQILNRTGKDIFDYSSGEPPEKYLTVLRVLEVTDPYVLRILINMAKIERIILAETRPEAMSFLRSIPGGGTAWTRDKHMNVRIYSDGGDAVTPMSMNNERKDTSLLFTGRDAVSEIRHHQQQIKIHEQEHQLVVQARQRKKDEWAVERRKLDTLKKGLTRAGDKFRRARLALDKLKQAANEDMPINIASLQAAKEEAEEEKQVLLDQAADVMRQKQEVDDKNKALLPKLKEVKNSMKDFSERKSGLVAKAADAAEVRQRAQHDRDSYAKKLNDEKESIAKVKAVAKVLEDEYMKWTKKAEGVCERVPNPRKVEIVQAKLKSVEAALKERERRHGATVEEMAIVFNRTKSKYETTKNDLEQLTALNKALNESLDVRVNRWNDFLQHIALRCKRIFSFNLSERAYFGKVLFDHHNRKMILKVVTDDQAMAQGAWQDRRAKDPLALSGGEKSFATICLLLALWESIGSPLRCLVPFEGVESNANGADEFDVFMDAVNRRVAMKMIIDTANATDKKQFILITPQDMGATQLGPTMKVNRMTDPERANQQ